MIIYFNSFLFNLICLILFLHNCSSFLTYVYLESQFDCVARANQVNKSNSELQNIILI